MARRRNEALNRRNLTPRGEGTRTPVERFLIVCEGAKTEPNYFRQFRISLRPEVVQVDIAGLGDNTVSLVRKAIERKKQQRFDQVWCVFDRDDFPHNNVHHAIALARENKIHVAFSNQSFELWYLLHFHFFNTAITRTDYIAKLSKLLGSKYEKNDPATYARLVARQSTAIVNAKRLEQEHTGQEPANADPSTTVYKLVEQMNRFVR